MTVPQRLLAVPILAGVLYLSVVLAGLSGFDSSIWALYTVLFLIWHILMHVQGPPLAVVIMVHAIVAAAFLGLGALIGQWVGFAPSPFAALGIGAAATALARFVRLSPEEAEEIAALAENIQIEALRTPAPPSPQQAPGIDPVPPEAKLGEDEAEAAQGALARAINALPETAPRHHDLVAAITPAIGTVPLRDLVSALFERARATGCPRDLQAVTVLLTDPHVAANSLGQADLEAAFHLMIAAQDESALSHWAMQTEAVLDLVPEALNDLPDAETLLDAADAHGMARDILRALAERRANSPESPTP